MINSSIFYYLWRLFSLRYQRSIAGGFVVAFVSSLVASSFIPYRINGEFSWANFFFIAAITFLNLTFIDRLTSAEVKKARQDSAECQRLFDLIVALKNRVDDGQTTRPTEEAVDPPEKKEQDNDES